MADALVVGLPQLLLDRALARIPRPRAAGRTSTGPRISRAESAAESTPQHGDDLDSRITRSREEQRRNRRVKVSGGAIKGLGTREDVPARAFDPLLINLTER